MNRLTEKISNEILVKNKNGNGSRSICYGCDGISNCTTRVCNFYRAMEKLAAYEDTGFEPEQIKQLNNAFINSQKKLEKAFDDLFKYKDLEEQGLLIKLPCAIGDMVYLIHEVARCERTIEPVKFGIALYGYFNKTVFLTREEAEKALEEMEGK